MKRGPRMGKCNSSFVASRYAGAATQMVDIAQQFNFLLLDVVELHESERIIATMRAGKIEIRKIFKIGFVPCEARPAKHEDTRTGLNRLRRRKARFDSLV